MGRLIEGNNLLDLLIDHQGFKYRGAAYVSFPLTLRATRPSRAWCLFQPFRFYAVALRYSMLGIGTSSGQAGHNFSDQALMNAEF